jgi:hypothetical protein
MGLDSGMGRWGDGETHGTVAQRWHSAPKLAQWPKAGTSLQQSWHKPAAKHAL